MGIRAIGRLRLSTYLQIVPRPVAGAFHYQMPRTGPNPPVRRDFGRQEPDLPRPTLRFRLRAWREFQHALDPLAPPRPLPNRPQQR
jgi:hypothetical protein